MKSRLLAIGLAAVSAVLVACGGGGGGPTPPTSTATPAPATPTPYGYGDSMTFGGSQTTAATFDYPSPSPYPSTSSTVTLAQSVAVGSSPNPYGPASAGDFHTVETDAAALVTRTTTTDAWLGLSGSNLVEYGYKSIDDSGNSLSAQFSTPVTLDQYPETNGASWSNGAGTVFNEKDADGTKSTRTYAPSGTYVESTTFNAIGVTTSITENADGSGIINGNGYYLGGNVQDIAISTPAPGGQITVTVNYVQPPTPSPAPSGQPSPTPAPTIAPAIYTAPAWYGTSPPVFYAQNTTVTAGVAYPASCSVPPAYGTSGNELVQTTNRLDTILGYTDAQTQTTYTNPQYGPVCVVLSDVQNDFYDYQDDFAAANGFHLHFPGTVLSTTTIERTLTLQSGAVVHAAVSTARIAAVAAALTMRSERARHRREMQFLRAIASHSNKGVR